MLRMNSVRAFLLFSKIRIFAANIDHISNGRFTLNVVSAWWEEEGGIFTEHDERYESTLEFLDVLKGLWTEETFLLPW